MYANKGIYESPYVGKYEGQFDDGMVHGYAVFNMVCGKTYKGHFDKGLMQGHGKIIERHGKITEGIWNKGKMVRKKGKIMNKVVMSFMQLMKHHL